MKKVFLLLVCCLVSLYSFAVVNGGNSGIGVTYYIQITDNGVMPSNTADFSYKAQIVGKDDWVNSMGGLDCGIVTLAGRLYVKIYGGAFDKPFDLGISIEIELTQISTGKVIKKTIMPTTVSGLQRWDAPNGMEMNDAEVPVVLKIDVSDLVLCTGVAGSVTATVTGVEGPYTVTWSPEITASGADGTTGNIPASLTEGTYRATVTTAAGTAFKDFTVTVLPVPDKPGITLEAQQNAGERQLSFKVSNEPAEHGFAYSWFVNNREVQPGGERFVAENLRDGDVVVCKTVGGGECASGVVSDEFVVDHRQVARQAGEEYFVPNLITPNGDGLNDTWRLDWLQSYPKHLVTVYSSRGKMVYQSDHYQNDWDGRVNGKTTYGVFTYKIDLPGGVVLQSWVEVRPAHR